MKAPAESLELLLAKAVAIAGGLGRVVTCAVAFDRQDVPARLLWVHRDKVNSVARHPELADHLHAAARQLVGSHLGRGER